MTTPLDKVLYTAEAHTTGGRDGAGKSSDGAIDLQLSSPGSGKPGTNPEELIGASHAACFSMDRMFTSTVICGAWGAE